MTKKKIQKDAPFEIMGHEFKNITELLDSVEIMVSSEDTGLYANPCKYLYCPQPAQITPKVKKPGLHILSFVNNVPSSEPVQEFINGYFEYGEGGNEMFVSYNNPVPLSPYPDEYYGGSYSEYSFFFSTEPFTDLEIGTIWGWVGGGYDALPECVLPIVDYNSLNDFITIMDAGYDDSEKLFLEDSDSILYKDDVSKSLFDATESSENVSLFDDTENFEVENPKHRILYVHGFRSSGSSGTPMAIHRLMPDCLVISPDLPVNGEEALALLKRMVEEEKIDVVVGTSMGGMLAQKLRGVYKILVNPSFHVSETFRKNMGVVSYFKPRLDGVTEFEITPEIVESYERLENGQFDGIVDDEQGITVGVFGRNDDIVNCLDEFKEHYTKVRFFDGGHRLDEDAIQRVIVPTIEYSGCLTFQQCVDLLVEKTLKRFEKEVPEKGDFFPVIESFTALDEKGIVGKYGLIVKKMPSHIVPNPTRRFVEAVAYLRDASYKADSIEASGTNQEILAKLRDPGFPESLNYTFGRLLNMLEDL